MRRRLPTIIVMAAVAALAAGCKPAGSPPDPLSSQRQAIDKSKGVEQVLEQSAVSRRNEEETAK